MDLFKTKYVVYKAPTAEEHNVVYAVDVLNVNAFFSCRFFISTKARADLKTELTERVVHGIVNSDEFRNFWSNNGVELPSREDGNLTVVRVDKAHKQVFMFNVYSDNMKGITIPLWVEAYNEEHAGVLLDGVITNLGLSRLSCQAVRVK
ncbi:hypothetical protein [Salmonella phage SE13]|uniref:Uncharacterized protein n=1 Tax=Salmonella phage SE13 TaxID=2575325 RepID=A0A513ZWV4_9CAUD|nr:hypothetical protein HWC19_gp67 [Salmonella phage SE13]QDH45173.1 hypothetical protein [Salmonella phage SE13]